MRCSPVQGLMKCQALVLFIMSIINREVSCHDEYKYEYKFNGKTTKYFYIDSMQALCFNFFWDILYPLKNFFLTYILRLQLFA